VPGHYHPADRRSHIYVRVHQAQDGDYSNNLGCPTSLHQESAFQTITHAAGEVAEHSSANCIYALGQSPSICASRAGAPSRCSRAGRGGRPFRVQPRGPGRAPLRLRPSALYAPGRPPRSALSTRLPRPRTPHPAPPPPLPPAAGSRSDARPEAGSPGPERKSAEGAAQGRGARPGRNAGPGGARLRPRGQRPVL